MNGFDKTIIAGNVAQVPQLRKTVSGRDVMFINIAVGRDRINEDGTRTRAVTYIPVGVFGTKAANLERLITKGTCVCIEGHHTIYDKLKLSIIADDIQIVGCTALSQQPAEKKAEEEQQLSGDDFGDLDPDDE